MEASTSLIGDTPLKNKDLHRRTILKNAVEASPLRRRSLIQTPVILLEKVNDEHERSSRRSLVDMHRRLSNIPQASTLNDSNKVLKEQDVKEQYQICTKLYLENKITPQNAWKLQIIDALKHMAQQSSTDTLQVAGASLEVSAKVYGVRVDDIHSDGLKLASDMARSVAEKQTVQDIGDDGEDDDADKENAEPKKKKTRKTLTPGLKHTIAKDPASLRAKLPAAESKFFSIRTDADVSAIGNLYTNIRMDKSGYKFMLLSKEKAWNAQPDPSVAGINDPNCKQLPLAVTPLENIHICPPLNDFEVDEWDPEAEEKSIVEPSLIAQREEEVILDDNGIPIPELDGSIHDIFDNQDGGDEMADDEDIQSIHEEIAPQIRGDIARIVQLGPDVSGGLRTSEYSYNSIVNTHSGKVIDQIWAGPSHWKLKFIRRSSVRYSGRAANEVKPHRLGKRRAQPEMIDYTAEYEEFDMTKKLKIKKKPPTVDFHKITLPVPDSSCIRLMESINELMTKPGVCPVQKKPSVDYEVSAYKYENPNDSQYCSQQNGHTNMEDAPFDDNDADDVDMEEHVMAEQANFLGDNLVDCPEAVPKSHIAYALHAKKIDMKKLKAALWHILTHTTTEDNQQSGKVIPTTFSKVYQELPAFLPPKQREELSCSLSFIALLHLCNEQNLVLKQYPDYKDFGINGPREE